MRNSLDFFVNLGAFGNFRSAQIIGGLQVQPELCRCLQRDCQA